MATWGTTPAERAGPMPGDDLVDTPLIQVTRAVGIAAPAEEVWPWIAQIGSHELGRAGWHSHDRFDNGGVPSARELLPDVGEPAVGDTLVADPDFAWTVRAVEPDSFGHSPDRGAPRPGSTHVASTSAIGTWTTTLPGECPDPTTPWRPPPAHRPLPPTFRGFVGIECPEARETSGWARIGGGGRG